MKIDGGCHCGKVTFEAEVDPERVMVCHCTDCQTLSGTAFRTVVPAVAGSFRLLAGELKTYVKVAESGAERRQTFCPECGTPIFSAPAGEGEERVNLRAGAIRQREQLRPRRQIWFRSHRGWTQHLSDVDTVDTQPGSG